MESIDGLLERYQLAHGNLCPGIVLAIRMTALGCRLVGIEDPGGKDQKKLVVWIEIDRWLANAVETVTGARLGKRTMKFLDYGKLAATFLNVETGEAVRIFALESSRHLAEQRHLEITSKFVRQMNVYRQASDEELFSVRAVNIKLNENDAPGHPRSRVICARCGEEVNDGREVKSLDDGTLCRPCAFRVFRMKFVTNEVNDVLSYTGLSRPDRKSDAVAV